MILSPCWCCQNLRNNVFVCTINRTMLSLTYKSRRRLWGLRQAVKDAIADTQRTDEVKVLSLTSGHVQEESARQRRVDCCSCRESQSAALSQSLQHSAATPALAASEAESAHIVITYTGFQLKCSLTVTTATQLQYSYTTYPKSGYVV